MWSVGYGIAYTWIFAAFALLITSVSYMETTPDQDGRSWLRMALITYVMVIPLFAGLFALMLLANEPRGLLAYVGGLVCGSVVHGVWLLWMLFEATRSTAWTLSLFVFLMLGPPVVAMRWARRTRVVT